MVAAVARRQGKEPTATLTASSFDLDQFGGQGPSLPAVMARYDRTYALAHAATLILRSARSTSYWTHMSRQLGHGSGKVVSMLPHTTDRCQSRMQVRLILQRRSTIT